jgi:hypothetical protein
MSGLQQPLFNLGYGIGQSIGKAILGDPEEKQRSELQSQQTMQQLDAISRQQMQQQDQLLNNAAEQARRLDDQRRNDTLSNLRGVPSTDDLTLRPATDFFGIPANPKNDASPQVDTSAAVDLRPVPPQAASAASCKWGDLDSSVVDLRCLGLDPNKPIVIDPHIARGKERAFPAQIDPATFENANYNNGFDALFQPGVAQARMAIRSFKQAQMERPNDPLVRNALGLAEDCLKYRSLKEREDKAQAKQSFTHGLVAIVTGDVNAADTSMKSAQELDPANPIIARWSMTTSMMSARYGSAATPEMKRATKLIGNAYLAEALGDYGSEVKIMEAAKQLAPDDTYVGVILDHARHLQAKYPARAAAAAK